MLNVVYVVLGTEPRAVRRLVKCSIRRAVSPTYFSDIEIILKGYFQVLLLNHISCHSSTSSSSSKQLEANLITIVTGKYSKPLAAFLVLS